MASFNKVILLGNITRDIEKRVTQKGTAVATFGLAMNRKYKTEDGKTAEEVTFVDVTAYGKQAETLEKYAKKGAPLHVEGRLKFETWIDKKSGQKRSHLRIVLESFQFIGAPAQRASDAAENANPPPPAGTGEDVPF